MQKKLPASSARVLHFSTLAVQARPCGPRTRPMAQIALWCWQANTPLRNPWIPYALGQRVRDVGGFSHIPNHTSQCGWFRGSQSIRRSSLLLLEREILTSDCSARPSDPREGYALSQR